MHKNDRYLGCKPFLCDCRTLLLHGIPLQTYHCVKIRCAEIRKLHRQKGYTAAEIRKICNAYGWGFCWGLEDACRKQEEKNQEWGLIMAVPEAVQTVADRIGAPSSYTRPTIDVWQKEYTKAGYQDGENFNPSQYLNS